MKPNSRLTAAGIIARWIECESFPDRQLADVTDDRAFVTELVFGVVRRKLTLEYIEQKYVNRRPEPFILAALHAGVYQLCFMDHVEEFAAIHETVEAVKNRRHPDAVRASRMVNAVLRNVQEEREALLKNLERQPDDIRLSHPETLLRRWTKQYGERDTLRLCEWNNLPAETVLRVEPSRVEPSVFVRTLEEAGIRLTPHPFPCTESFYLLPRGIPVPRIPGYEKGWFTVQDPATAVSVDLLDPRPGECVLDACAAPGGKTAIIAGRMKGTGEVIAMDVHDDRLEILNETVARIGQKIVRTVKGNAAYGFPEKEKLFDAILLDVPCMNTGVLRRRADARWRFRRERMEMIKKNQRQILTAMAGVLKPGGRLVYSTCSLETEENEEQISRWVREHPAFRFIKAKRLFPPKTGTDGAYAALIKREPES